MQQMTRSKRIFLTLLVLAMVLALAGCGGRKQTPVAEEPTAEIVASTPQPAMEDSADDGDAEATPADEVSNDVADEESEMSADEGSGEATEAESEISADEEVVVAEATPAMGNGRGMGGPGSSMMQFHHAPIPDDYASLISPVATSDESVAAGKMTYDLFCTTCHGETGAGDGPAGLALDPPAAPIAQTSLMMGDAYLYWRISEGGAEFGTAMTPWKDILDEEQRWDVINYMRTFGGQQGGMGRGPGAGQAGGGQMVDEGAMRAAMLAEATDAELITADDAAIFEQVHAVLDEHYMADTMAMDGTGAANMQEMQRAMTDQAVADGHISQEAADSFTETHDLLIEAGIMR